MNVALTPWLERRDGQPMGTEDWIILGVVALIVLVDLFVIAHAITPPRL
jgi:hypothetical protein